MINSVDFAKYILQVAKERNIDMNVTKLQKLLYICDGMMLSCGVNAIDENARAWNYGPVYPKTHTWFIQTQGKDTQLSCDIQDKIKYNNYDRVVSQALDVFGSWTAGQLSNWSHKPGSPWQKALEKGCGKMNSIISKKDMAKYFKDFVYAS